MKTVNRLTTLLSIAATSSALAHETGLPHAHPHAVGADSNTLVVTGLAVLALVSSIILYRRVKNTSQR